MTVYCIDRLDRQPKARYASIHRAKGGTALAAEQHLRIHQLLPDFVSTCECELAPSLPPKPQAQASMGTWMAA